MSKYDPLRDYLKAQKHERVSMSFAEIEKLGITLPASARKHRPWWANDKHHSQSHSWLDAGFETEQVDMASHRLVFVKFIDLHSKSMKSDDAEIPDEEDDLLERLSEAEAKLVSFESESAGHFAGIKARQAVFERRIDELSEKKKEQEQEQTAGYLTAAGVIGFLVWVFL